MLYIYNYIYTANVNQNQNSPAPEIDNATELMCVNKAIEVYLNSLSSEPDPSSKLVVNLCDFELNTRHESLYLS